MSSKSRRQRTGPERSAVAMMRRRRSGPVEPIRIDTSVERVVDRVHVFSIDDVDYFMDAEHPPALALRMLEMTELKGEAAAMSYVLAEVLGEGHEALKNCEHLTNAQFEAIVDIVADAVMGALDSGKSETDSRS